MDHYRDLYHQAAVMELKEIILANDGSFVEEEGKFEVKLRSSILATQIYDAIVKARCVQELTVYLGWEVTQGDLQRFASTVTKANVVNLRLRGCGSGHPTNVDNSLFQPILQLMSNGRIQSMDIVTMNIHFPCVDASTMKCALKLRSLSISSTQHQTGESWPTLAKILDNCPSLTELTASNHHSRKICVYIQRNAPILRALKTVIVREEGLSAMMVLSQGTIEHFKASLQTPTFGEFEDDKDFLFGGYLSKLELTKIEEMDRDRFTAIIHRNPRLVKLGIIFRSKQWLDIVEWTQSATNDLASRGQRISLRNVVACIVSEASRVTHVMKFQGRSPMSKFSTKIKLFSTIANDDRISRLFRQYGGSFTALEARNLPDNELGRLVPLLSNSTEKAGSKLESLILELRGLPLDCLECIDRVIERSAGLKDLRFTLSLDDERRQEKAEWLSGRHGNSLTGLIVCGNGVAPWTAETAQWLPRRRDLPKLKKIEIRGFDITQHSQSFALWISDIVSAPPPPSRRPASSTPSQLVLPNVSTISVSSPDTWTRLTTIKIWDAVLSEEQWLAVFEAIDFTALNELDFNGPEFSLERFQALINSIPNSREYGGILPLKKLSFAFESVELYQRDELETLVATLAEKAPQANVFGLPGFKK
ncbi:hypothetical protein EDD21DRAFT_361459 [Dissophora ornata]|nr:hypothetical protein EDD21DRAFT_361459 [Dissophora ornata]